MFADDKSSFFVIAKLTLTKNSFDGNVDSSESLNTNPGFAVKVTLRILVIPEIGDRVALNDSWAWGSSIARGNLNSFLIISKLFISIVPSSWNLAISSSVMLAFTKLVFAVISILSLTVNGTDDMFFAS